MLNVFKYTCVQRINILLGNRGDEEIKVIYVGKSFYKTRHCSA